MMLSLGIYLGYTVHSSETYIVTDTIKETKYVRMLGRYNIGWSLEHHMKDYSYKLSLLFYSDKHDEEEKLKNRYSFFGFPYKF
jgi:hypothetical protein